MPHKRPRLLPAFAAALFTFAVPVLAAPPPPTVKPHDLDLSAMDKSASPCTNFYQYANGHWLARTAIPAEYPDWDSFGILYERNLATLHALVEKAAANKTAPASSPAGKVGSFYRSGMNQSRRDAEGVKPLAPQLAQINAVTDVPGLLAEIGRLHRAGVSAAFTVGVEQDPGASTNQIAAAAQGGISLPEPGYYSRTDKETAGIRAAFVAYAAQMFGFLGETKTQAAADAQTVLNTETKLAAASKSPVELRDPLANYHRMTLTDLNALTPGVDWQPYFDAVHLPTPGAIDVGQPAFFTALGTQMTATPLADWKTYLRWQLISASAPALSKPIGDAQFHFYGTVLSGVKKRSALWKRMVNATDSFLGDDLGRLYVVQNFPPAAKARALALVKNLKAVLRDDLSQLPWMTPATRKEALLKLDAYGIKIGYPDKWRDYSTLDVSSPDYVVNRQHAIEFEFQRQLNKIGKPVDRGEWGMSPPTVNAYYNPQMNDINFPAGILQPPFFDAKADDALNYGAIGMVIGHEMTHGFDDQGRQYDAKGNLRDWWTASDAKQFAGRAKGIVTQYSAYTPLPGARINGELTQGENIADIGGIKIAYLALEKSLKGKPRTKIDGFTPEQRFFLAFAQLWRDKELPQSEKVRLATDPHSPDKYRVLGALADTPEFRKAFGCPPDPKASSTTIW